MNDRLKNVPALPAEVFEDSVYGVPPCPYIEILMINSCSHGASGKSLPLLTNGSTSFRPITHPISPFALAQFNAQLQ